MVINNNISALMANNALFKNQLSVNKSIKKLSSGLRISTASDDAAGLAVSEKMRSQIRGYEMAKRNIQDGISLVQTAEGAMDEVHNMLQRMRELAVQANNGVYTTDDKNNLKAEATELITQIGDITAKANFNGVNLLTGGANINIQTGIKDGDVATISGLNLTAQTLGINGLDITAAGSIGKLDTAITKISTERAKFGAMQNRLEYSLSYTVNAHENLSAAESRIRDVDVAKEMSNFSSKQMLLQAGMSIAAQANQKTSLINRILG